MQSNIIKKLFDQWEEDEKNVLKKFIWEFELINKLRILSLSLMSQFEPQSSSVHED